MVSSVQNEQKGVLTVTALKPKITQTLDLSPIGVRRIPPLCLLFRAFPPVRAINSGRLWLCGFFVVVFSLLNSSASEFSPLRFEVSASPSVVTSASSGRLLVILSRTNAPEPRLTVTRTGIDAPVTLARDVTWSADVPNNQIDASAFIFPITNLLALSPGPYWVQALFMCNPDLCLPNAPGNWHGDPQKLMLDPGKAATIALELNHEIPPEEQPPDTDEVRFIKLKSERLSAFHHRPIYLRAGIILPRDFERERDRHYPLWVRIGGYGSRYTVVNRLIHDPREFRPTWLANETPRFILLQLDGAGPYGDPYYVNSANNGPYGDALVEELIPYVEKNFRGRSNGHARVLSGVSTGGWVTLALQIFYPSFFTGAWASCPDPVDFRAFELVDLYHDANAYTDAEGHERPSERNLKGEPVLSMRREVGLENLLGAGNSYARSGEQWGAWNAVYGPRGADGQPTALWEPLSGRIDHRIAKQWRKYDLRLVLQENWSTLVPHLRGKLHIASGEADQYYLNNAVHLLDAFLQHADPPAQATIVYGPGKGHGWSNLNLRQMLEEMAKATQEGPR